MRTQRRTFLAALGAAAGALLSACAKTTQQRSGAGPPAAVASDDLNRFMTLSAILTGYAVGDLDRQIGTAYLQNIRADSQRSAALDDMLQRGALASGSPPKTIADLQKAGVFTNFASHSLANEILENWYSGIYVVRGGQKTATWTQALAWKACAFTKPPSLCAIPGSWAKPPTA